ncbi:MAG TPA: NAD(P)-dependent oxidoreductase [Candidatus Omnitrophota bacterium]|nr:NAD(P)-dependent oxidoreductase [Candidatus Omnitrophota bacterium]
MDVIFYEAFEEEERAIKKWLPTDIKGRFTSKTIQETKDKTPSAGLISVRTQSDIPLGWARQIKAILTRSQGYDHIVNYCRESEFEGEAGYLGNYCARAVAEHAAMSMMMLFHRVKKQMKHFDSFKRDGLTGRECLNKNVCIIGVGNIGGQMVDILKGLKMNVKGVDIDPKFKGLEYVSLKEGVLWADAIVCALPLTDKTNGLLDYSLLKDARAGSIFINIARGEISPIEDLKRLLDNNLLAGLALDIFPDEASLAIHLRSGRGGLTKTNKTVLELKKRENVLFTPHNAFNTVEALEEKAKRSAQAVEAYLRKGVFPHPVPWP